MKTLVTFIHRESSKLEALRASYQQSIEGLRKEKVVPLFSFFSVTVPMSLSSLIHYPFSRKCWSDSWNMKGYDLKQRAGKPVWSHRKK